MEIRGTTQADWQAFRELRLLALATDLEREGTELMIRIMGKPL